MVTRPMKFGPFGSSIIKMPVGSGEIFKHLGGCFVCADDAGHVDIAATNMVDILGWAITHDHTAIASDGSTEVGVETDLEKLFKMPANYHASTVTACTEAQLDAAIGESFDIALISNVQYADLLTSTYDILIGYAYEYYGSAVNMQGMIVKINMAKIAYTTHS